jgi:hypothetical protein
MIEEYENWEDSIRHTFIEMTSYMDKNANPLDSIIDFAWSSGADLFFVNNAKDELKKLREEADTIREKSKEWSKEVFNSNQFAVEMTNDYLKTCEKMQELQDSLDKPVAWARMNKRGDLYDLRLCLNPYINPQEIVPLYANRKGYNNET